MASQPERIMMSTGGPLPPQPVTTTMRTGGPLPATPTSPSTGGNLPPLPTASPVPVMDWRARLREGDENAMTREVGGNELVANQLNALTAGNSQYIRQAEDRARSEASSRGMMFSTMAAGAGRRAAIDAALPIASQDAQTFGRVADANMAAVNQDRLADQNMWGTLTGQEVGIRANLAESERARGFTARENLLSRQHATGERLGAQDFQRTMQQMQNAWQGAQNNTQRTHELLTLERQQAHDSAMRILEHNFQGSQLDRQLLQQRFLEFENAMQNQGNQLAQVIASIYNNPNLKPDQQAAAVTNARAVFQSLFTSYAQSLSGGVPDIFWNPYQMPRTSILPGTPTPMPKPTPPRTTTGTGTGGLRIGDILRRTEPGR